MKLSENYYLRNCFLEREQVPTQSVMMKKMSPPLASVYFKSMSPKLKVLAGLEPPMKGAGNDWYIPPKTLLEEGRVVMKPIKNEYLKKLSCEGIGFFGEMLVNAHHKRMEEEKNRVLQESDLNWKKTIEAACRQQWEDCSKVAAKNNTEAIQHAFLEFTSLYTTSIAKIESLLFDATVEEIKRTRESSFQMMKTRFRNLLKRQATMLYDRYTEKLNIDKARLKAQFIENLENSRTEMADQVHDIRAEKHVAIEKLSHLLECQKIACQVYVALKEREECQKELELSKYEHKKKVKILQDKIAMKDFEIKLAKEKEKRREEFTRIWQKKVCEVVKKFQIFVSYCLNNLPGQADFFIDMEKLMLLQLNESLGNPSVDSIFEFEEPTEYQGPTPRPHPFFLFCDKGYKPDQNQRLDLNLCPKHCTSSASQLPVIIVNKRCIYAACDNFEVFTDKIKEYIHGKHGDDDDFVDDHSYTYDIPVKCTSSQELLHLKLESSLLQILQSEHPNLREVPDECCCKIPYCFYSPLHATSFAEMIRKETKKTPSATSMSSGNKVETRNAELEHEREPKWESYMKFIEPKKCVCAKTAKKHLVEHLPAYMRKMSTFEAPELLNYETCSLDTLKRLVKKARGKRPPPPEPPKLESKTKDIGVQYSDPEYDHLCTCFSDDQVKMLIRKLMHGSTSSNKFDPLQMIGGSVSPTYLQNRTPSFATQRAYSLRNLLVNEPELEEIFKKKDCAIK